MLASVTKDDNILIYKVQVEARGTRERRSFFMRPPEYMYIHTASGIYRAPRIYNAYSSAEDVHTIIIIIIMIDCEQPSRLCGARSGSPQ